MSEVRAKKALGQHFLVDLNIARKICDALSGGVRPEAGAETRAVAAGSADADAETRTRVAGYAGAGAEARTMAAGSADAGAEARTKATGTADADAETRFRLFLPPPTSAWATPSPPSLTPPACRITPATTAVTALCAKQASTSTPWSTALAIRRCKETPNTKASAEASADAFCLPGAPGHCFLGNTKGLQRYTATRYRVMKHHTTGSHRITAL